jgi:hypothetical protein
MSLMLLPFASQAQMSKGGIPASMKEFVATGEHTKHILQQPDWREASKPVPSLNAPALVALLTEADIHFPASGSFSQSREGNLIWRSSIQVAQAPGIGLYFDKFHLPEGCSLYLYNESRTQILGAFTSLNNTASGQFATEAVQGNTVHLELNLSKQVNPADIQLHINRAAVYFRAIEHLTQYAHVRPINSDPDTAGLQGTSSTCMINAICPEGADYAEARKSAVQILIPFGSGLGACSGTMINNTGNDGSGTCKPLLLTASHCEFTGTGATDADFAQWLFRFNYEKENCDDTVAATVNTLVGAKFRARSPYNPQGHSLNVSDFMLLELQDAIPDSWDVYLAGWDRASEQAQTLSGSKKYIGFHHPQGDVKKLSFTQGITANMPLYRVLMFASDASTGGLAPGSSGSGLFNGEKLLMGIAAQAGEPLPECGTDDLSNPSATDTFFLSLGLFTRIDDAWEYGTENNRRLKPWLDPANSEVLSLNTTSTSACMGHTAIEVMQKNDDDQYIAVYPNPAKDGLVHVQVNLPEGRQEMNVELFDIAGKKVGNFALGKASQIHALDVSHLPQGAYLLRFYSKGQLHASKKIMITR